MRKGAWKIGVFAGACALTACASIFGIHTGELEDGGAGDAATDVPSDYVVHDAIDLDVNTAVCEGGVSPVSADQAVWVSGAGSDVSSCGTQTSPCKTIGFALSVRGTRTVVYADHATFTEALALGASQANVTIQGGFVYDGGGGWSPQCDTSLTTIQAPDEAGAAAIDIQGTSGVTLRLLTVRSKTNGDLDETVYAVRVIDSTAVLLDNVSMLAQNGGQGTMGTGGSTGGCVTGGNGTGAAGAPGGPGSFGTIGPNGYQVTIAPAGDAGDIGTSTDGGTGRCTGPCIVSCQ